VSDGVLVLQRDDGESLNAAAPPPGGSRRAGTEETVDDSDDKDGNLDLELRFPGGVEVTGTTTTAARAAAAPAPAVRRDDDFTITDANSPDEDDFVAAPDRGKFTAFPPVVGRAPTAFPTPQDVRLDAERWGGSGGGGCRSWRERERRAEVGGSDLSMVFVIYG
jgi:hypothetical protein